VLPLVLNIVLGRKSSQVSAISNAKKQDIPCCDVPLLMLLIQGFFHNRSKTFSFGHINVNKHILPPIEDYTLLSCYADIAPAYSCSLTILLYTYSYFNTLEINKKGCNFQN